MTKMRAALLLSSCTSLCMACAGKSYSLGGPSAGQNAGGAASESSGGGYPDKQGITMGGADSTAGSGTGSAAGSSGTNSHGVASPLFHRAAAVPCPKQRGAGSVMGLECPSGPPTCCSADSQCYPTTGPVLIPFAESGRCNNNGKVLPSCSYDECFTDSDCASGSLCLCRDSPSDYAANVCTKGNCVVDSDCGPSGFCSPSPSPLTCGAGPYYCHTALDTCMNDNDCTGSTLPAFPSCEYDVQAQRWDCSQAQCPGFP
jgi:hypothetical protein